MQGQTENGRTAEDDSEAGNGDMGTDAKKQERSLRDTRRQEGPAPDAKKQE